MSFAGVSVKLDSLKSNTAAEYATRFLFGGAISVIAAITAKHYGPVVAGLLLAFPAIFPASATLVEDHEKQKKSKIGKDGERRGRDAAAVDAEGSSLGSIGLIAFALLTWKTLPLHSAGLTLLIATTAWAVVAVTCWYLRRRI